MNLFMNDTYFLNLAGVAFLARLVAVVERFVKIIKINAVVLIWQETAIRGMNLFT